MRDKNLEAEYFSNKKTVYGPVSSWRYGESLGIDPIFETSSCSFNCIYCQLGQIQNITTVHKVYVPTQQVLKDFKHLLDNQTKIDVITYSGSGEPTLAANLGDMVSGIRQLAPEIPQFILTNATELYRAEVRENLLDIDKVIVKIDASDEKTFQMINRPAEGVTLERTIQGILDFKKIYDGSIEVQTMLMPINNKHIEELAAILKRLAPDLVQMNTPKRPYPLEWHRENRGNHKLIFDYETRILNVVTPEDAQKIEDKLKALTGLEFSSIYRK